MSSAVRRETILIVNSNARSRRVLSDLFRRAGYLVREAGADEASVRAEAAAAADAAVLGGPLDAAAHRRISLWISEAAGPRPAPVLHLVRKREVEHVRRQLRNPEEEAVLDTPADAPALISCVAALLQAREARLAEQQARHWQEVFDAFYDGICVIDMEGRLLQCNQAMGDLIGKPIREAVGGTCDQLAAEANERVIRPLLARMAETHARESAIVPVGPRWYRLTVDPIPRAAEQPTGAVLAISDVTTEVRAEQAGSRLLEVERARAREARFLDLVVESTPNMLAYIDRDLRFVKVNSRYAEGHGATARELVGRTVGELFGEASEAFQLITQVRDTGEPLWLSEAPPAVVLEGAEDIRYDIAVTPVKDEGGEVEGMVISLMDVSEKVRLREEQLGRERLSRQLAETISADIRHRVKNNLMLLAGLLQMQVSAEPDSAVAVTLRDTISRLLTFADLHAQLGISPDEEMDLLEAVRRIGEITQRVFAEHNIEIIVDGESINYPPEAITALAIAVNELVTNAVKHGAPAANDRLQVRVSVGRHDEMLCIAVWNSGNPVPESFSIDERTHLGLRLVRDLAASRHHGSLTLRPEGDGTCVEMHLDDASLRTEG